ncbi:MAG: hypothetical protein FJY11_06125 [Bacteroidetes bacterium]|nr:hypothetical protein [Bacteroidota bacterium]
MASSRKTHNGITTGATVTSYYGFEDSDLGVHLTYTFLSGVGKSHFEAKLGGVLNLMSLSGSSSVEFYFLPVISLGYRYQPPDRNNFYRIGLSTAGLGFGFGTIIKLKTDYKPATLNPEP